ncbi:hypothetical protein TNCV_4162371 [Trichonephila clavipes]|nr:hypothetical protein TNCV_4162371 [Trichonephila clavipes]
MLIDFFDINGIIKIECLPQGQTRKQQYYIKVMRKLRERVRKKRPDLQSNNTRILHRDNSPDAHCALCKTVFSGQTHYCAQGSPLLPRSGTI